MIHAARNGMRSINSTYAGNSFAEKRSDKRRDFGNHPITVRKKDGTKIKAILNNLCRGGLQIKCNRLSANILSTRKGLLPSDNQPTVEISVLLPTRKGLKKIMANCKMRYVAVTKDIDPVNSYVIGLKVIAYKGKSDRVVKELLEGLTLPNLQQNVDPAMNF